jgi:hypothetical protein
MPTERLSLPIAKDIEPSKHISGSTSASTQLAQVRPGTWREPYPAQPYKLFEVFLPTIQLYKGLGL